MMRWTLSAQRLAGFLPPRVQEIWETHAETKPITNGWPTAGTTPLAATEIEPRTTALERLGAILARQEAFPQGSNRFRDRVVRREITVETAMQMLTQPCQPES